MSSKASVSDYWYYTGLILAQFKGLQLGYAMAAPPAQVCECVCVCVCVCAYLHTCGYGGIGVCMCHDVRVHVCF